MLLAQNPQLHQQASPWQWCHQVSAFCCSKRLFIHLNRRDKEVLSPVVYQDLTTNSSAKLEIAPVKALDAIWQRIKVHTCLHASAPTAIECRPSMCYSWMLVAIKTCQRTCLLFSALQGCSNNRCLAVSSSDLFETENTLTESSSFPSSLNDF